MKTAGAQTTQDEEVRQRLRSFIEENHPGTAPHAPRERLAWMLSWSRLLADRGYAAPSWPKRWGGMELPFSQQLIYHEELARARLRPHPYHTQWTVGPVLMHHGTTAQCERFLRPMLRGDELWCQGFSEPNAGSDLPGLQTRAVRDGAEYIVNGQKIWTSHADTADWIFALVRTGSTESRQKGLSYLLIDMKSEGLEVRPIRDIAGGKRFCETFFRDVRVPVANRVGAENDGWAVARTTLGQERSAAFVGNGIRYRKILDELEELARQGDCDQALRRELARLEEEVLILRLNYTRVFRSLSQQADPGPVSSISHLFYRQLEQRLHETAMKVIGSYGLITKEDSLAVQRGRWVAGFLATRGSTIGGGTIQIQRNTIGEQILGLPRDPGMPGAKETAGVLQSAE
jgi:alkylation response protein AidB-like acyl-CoA dehydrogenase